MKLGSQGATKLIGALALILVAGAGWLFLMSPQANALAEVRTRIETTRSENVALRQRLVVLHGQQSHLKETRTTAQALASKFPPTADQPELFRAVTTAATTAGIPARSITALTPTPPVAGSGKPAAGAPLPGKTTAAQLATQDVSLTVEGSYEKVLRLTKNLERMPRAYLITGLTLGAGTTPGTFSATISGQMFVMPPAKDPASVKALPSGN
jgi:Tfp pilus assembly protein PilO